MKGLIIVMICLSASVANAQEYKSSEVPNTLHLILGSASVEIQGSATNEISVIRTNGRPTNPRADGLTQVGKGTDNTGVGMNRQDSERLLVLEELSQKIKNSYVIRVQHYINLIVEETWWSGSGIEVSDVQGSVTINANNSSVLVKRLTGTVTIKSISGDVTGSFGEIGSSVKMHSISGDALARVSESANADLSLETISGSISTNVNVEPKLDPKYGVLKQIGHGRKLQAKLNEGGILISVSTISGSASVLTITQN